MKHQLVLRDMAHSFQDRVDELTEAGWHIVPGSISIQDVERGTWFSCVLQREETDSNSTVPLDKLMVGLAAASDSLVVRLQYSADSGHWSVFRDFGNQMGVVIGSVTDDPYRSLAAAILEVQKNGS